jgi:flagellar protein FliO/FliZ
LFGGGHQFFVLLLVFIAAFGLLTLAYWLVRQSRRAQRGSAAPAPRRGSRIAVVGGAKIDARRRLVLIRRDNVEHLLLVGGAADLLVEQNIVRPADAAHEISRPEPSGRDALPGPAPHGASMGRPKPERAGRTEPKQPPGPPARRPGPAAPRFEEGPAWAGHEVAPPPSAWRERRVGPEILAGLPEEPSGAPITGETEKTAAPPRPASPRVSRARPQAMPPAAPAGGAKASSSPDADLGEMARRLEAALGRPHSDDESRARTERSETAENETETHVPASQYDSLEQELAGLFEPGSARSAGPQLDNADEDRTDKGDTRRD